MVECNSTFLFINLCVEYTIVAAEEESAVTTVDCQGCGETGKPGVPYKCAVCKDFRLCNDCLTSGIHSKHEFRVMLEQPEATVSVRFHLTFLAACW